ncbi:hypothetical protein CN378_09780 [Bacillus sp. AFS015802]|uniref:galactosyltransferase-related protein n=1 Tax=Bacillus sp. AFS015802 TaxID=2033486 RepID=UPI000BF6AE63|nr:galactosyltransferase-related protein [Bacillus sp. AFS015802]PFA67800.1 hypothetical protein CN378_09780 [Bacillus sp. AFS015802]
MEISILIPFNSESEIRKRSFEWIKRYYTLAFPESDVCVGTSTGSLFSKAEAVNHAASVAQGEVYVIVDSDIICDPNIIKGSIKLLDTEPWIIPYNKVLDITQNSSTEILNTEPLWPLPDALDTNPRNTTGVIPVGGINIIKKECFEKVGGFDERFKGWGGEDDAFASSVNTFCGHFKRIPTSIYHLWHPTEKSKNIHYQSNYDLAMRYCKAHRKKEKMKKIMNEREER